MYFSSSFQCIICYKDLKNKRSLTAHNRTHENPQHRCLKCAKIFHTTVQLKQHTEKYHEMKTFSCGYCEYENAKEGVVKTHTIKHHTKQFPLTCSICKVGFNFNYQLKEHTEMQHEGIIYSCTLCPRTFKRKQLLGWHQSVHQTDKKPLICEICRQIYMSRGGFRRHMRTHTREYVKPICDLCGKCFASNEHLRRHLKIHAGIKDFACEICSKAFTTLADLKLHIRTHTKEKPYLCNECGKSFSQKGSLRLHVLLHSGIKPFKCIGCDKAFVTKTQLNSHKCAGDKTDFL